jgi:hypothetical protein
MCRLDWLILRGDICIVPDHTIIAGILKPSLPAVVLMGHQVMSLRKYKSDPSGEQCCEKANGTECHKFISTLEYLP